MLFQHLIDPDVTLIDDATPQELVGAQMRTADFLADDEDATLPRPPTPRDTSLARQAFGAVLSPDATLESTKKHVMALTTPEAVRHHVAMLSQYDWEFVQQAKELRGFVVAKLLKESEHPDARIRLRAVELIGKLTEVASFTERQEVIHKNEDSSQIEERLRAKLKSLLPPVQEVQDTEVKDIAVVARTAKLKE